MSIRSIGSICTATLSDMKNSFQKQEMGPAALRRRYFLPGPRRFPPIFNRVKAVCSVALTSHEERHRKIVSQGGEYCFKPLSRIEGNFHEWPIHWRKPGPETTAFHGLAGRARDHRLCSRARSEDSCP